MAPPFRLTVYRKGYVRAGWVGNPLAVKVNPRHNDLSTATITLAADHPRAADLMEPGTRVHVDYHGARIIGGPVRGWAGTGPARRATLTVTVHDDWRLLGRMLGWQVPGNALTAQSAVYYKHKAPAETVVKAIVSANAARLGIPVVIAPDLARGEVVSLSSRMPHRVVDRVVPLLDRAGIGVRVWREADGYHLDTYVPATYPRTLTERSGVVREWEWTRTAPEATRTVGGGAGEGTARAYYGPLVNTALETLWDDVVEVFTDARNNADEVPDAMGTKLAEGRGRAGLKVALSETATFRYGATVSVGDRLALEVGPGIVLDDVLREAELEWTAAGGLTVNPVVGDRDDPATLYARALSRLGRGLRDLTAER